MLLIDKVGESQATQIVYSMCEIASYYGMSLYGVTDVDVHDVTINDFIAGSSSVRALMNRHDCRLFYETAGLISEKPLVVGIPSVAIGHPDVPALVEYDPSDVMSEALATVACAGKVLNILNSL